MLIDSAIAICGVNGPSSAAVSLVTLYDPGGASAWSLVRRRSGRPRSAGGMYSGSKPSSVLVCAFIPSETAVDST